MPATRWLQAVPRSFYAQAQFTRHRLHVLTDVWELENCEYCRTEYYMELPPLGAE